MRHPRSLLLVLAAMVVFPPAGCGGGASQAEKLIGPEGGVVEVTDSSSPIFGMKVEVPPGALAEESSVVIRIRTDAPDLPRLQAGLAAFGPLVELLSDIPFEEDVDIFFPIRTTEFKSDQIPSGFHPDDETDGWRMLMLRRIEPGAFIVRTRELGFWRFGVTLLEEVEYEALKPAMEDVHGVDEWADIESAVEAEYEVDFQELKELETWSDCDSLDRIKSGFETLRNTLRQDVVELLAASCSGCELTPDMFLDEMLRYIRARVQNELINLIIELLDSSFLLELYAKLGAYEYFQTLISQLSCDYDCLLEDTPDGFWGTVVLYHVTGIVLVFMIVGGEYTDCI